MHGGSFSACSRADVRGLNGSTDGKDGPAPVSWLADSRPRPRAFPHVRRRRVRVVPGAVAAGSGRLRVGTSAYSGGTAWDSHPLRVVAGKRRRVQRRLASVVPASIAAHGALAGDTTALTLDRGAPGPSAG